MPTPDGDARSQAVAAIRSARAITAVCHENPDADTVAGALAIAHIGRLLGKETEVVSADGIPPNLHFLPGAGAVRHEPALAPDLVVVCDAATFERVGSLGKHREGLWSGSRLLNLDHHRTNSRFGDINLVEPDAAATCQILAELQPFLDVVLDAALATVLLTGIVRDTQGFSDSATSARTLELVAAQVEAGAVLADVQRRVLHELPFATMRLWGRLLATAQSEMDGKIVYTILTPEMLRDTETQQHDADGVVEFMSRSSGAAVVLLVRELGRDSTRVSIRTLDHVDATRIAEVFGGGGHSTRAGFVADESRDTILRMLIRTATDLIRVSDSAK